MSQGMHETLDIGMHIVSPRTHEALDVNIRLCRRECIKPCTSRRYSTKRAPCTSPCR